MTDIKFYNQVEDSKLSFAVVIARMSGQWVLCKHKDRTTYELPGGHRENGESLFETAARELREETGAVDFWLKRICCYSVRGTTREGEELAEETFGALYRALIKTRTDDLDSEIEEVVLVNYLDRRINWTYPLITPKLIDKALYKIVQAEDGSGYFLVYDENYTGNLLDSTPFLEWLKSEGFKFHEVYHGYAPAVWVNLNYKIIAHKLGIRCFEEIGHHAITVDEFKTIYAIYKKYEGKPPLVFD